MYIDWIVLVALLLTFSWNYFKNEAITPKNKKIIGWLTIVLAVLLVLRLIFQLFQ